MRRLAPLALTLIAWTVPDCAPHHLTMRDKYIRYSGELDEGSRTMPPTQTSVDLAPGKPMPGCAIAWWAPVAVDSLGVPLPAECQPVIVSVDGQTWDGV